MASFHDVADDFFVNTNIQTTLALPSSRETVLHFFEAVQKEFSQMTSFFQRETGEFVLEGDREGGTYPWLELQPRHFSAGYFNPADVEAAYRYHQWLLDRSVYYLGLSSLDIECMDVLYGCNLDYLGNRDAIVAQAMLMNSPLGSLLADEHARAIEFEPSMVIALDEGCYLQARLSLETRSSSYQVRTGQYEDEPISIYFTVRRHPVPGRLLDMKESFIQQCQIGEDMVQRVVIPQIIEPIAAAIASAQ